MLSCPELTGNRMLIVCDVTCEDRATYERWGSARFADHQLSQVGTNRFQPDKEKKDDHTELVIDN